jgi:hypothetical protein
VTTWILHKSLDVHDSQVGIDEWLETVGNVGKNVLYLQYHISVEGELPQMAATTYQANDKDLTFSWPGGWHLRSDSHALI